MAMARNPDIREEVQHYIDSLIAAYELSDPEKGAESELGKIEQARLAINIWWKLYDRLLLWAQAHMTGYAMTSNMPELTAFINENTGKDLTENCHILEQLGYIYTHNPLNTNHPDYNYAQKLLEDFDAAADENNFDEFGSPPDYLHAVAFRFLVNELLMSTGANSSYWRFPLQRSLRALNEGEADAIAAPIKGRHGRPYFLQQWKLEALGQVYFRVGRGMKKHRAIKEVADKICQSTDTIRDWEKGFKNNSDYRVHLICCELAGQYEDQIKDGSINSIENFNSYPIHRGLNYLQHAKHLYSALSDRDLNEIRERILEHRLPPK